MPVAQGILGISANEGVGKLVGGICNKNWTKTSIKKGLNGEMSFNGGGIYSEGLG